MVRKDIRAVIYYILLVLLAVSMWVTILFLPRTGPVMYNCSIAEISPDFPIEAREQCRKIRAESFKRDTTR